MTNRRDFILGGTALAALSAPAQPVRSILGSTGNNLICSPKEPSWNPYVTKGLITFVDAEWNEAPLVHNDSMIGANDLVGDSNLTQYSTFPYLANNGNAWVKSSNASLIIDKAGILSFPSQEFTVQFCCYFSRGGGVHFTISRKFVTSYSSWRGRVELAWQRLSCGTNYSWANYDGFPTGWQSHTLTVTGRPTKLITLYVDGEEVKASMINEYEKLLTTNYMMFGGNLEVAEGKNITNQASTGELYYNCLIYNRALTADECAHNHQVDKERFGI